MRGFSLRTLMLVMLGMAILSALFTTRGYTQLSAHTLLVLAFALPGGSYGYDRTGTSRGLAIGTCVAAVFGTLTLGGAVLAIDVIDMWR